MDEFPDVSFYVLNEPLMSAPEPDEIGIWQELAHVRTENYAWRECVSGVLNDAEQHRHSSEALKAAIQGRVVALGERVAKTHHR